MNSYLFASAAAAAIRVDEFSYTGASETFVVPAGYDTITVQLWGGGGGGSVYVGNSSYGGPCGYLQADFPVTPGDVLKFEVGQGGRAGDSVTPLGGAGGWPDGGGGARGDVFCGGGGGSTRFYINSALKAVSGGGGGGAYNQGNGGPGGGTTGGTGYDNTSGHSGNLGSDCGSGGSQVAGGVDLSDSGNANKTGRSIVSFPGAQRTGGWGGSTGDITTNTSDDGGGGGGGYYGGGGGGGDGRAGGGGSSWTDSDASNISHKQAAHCVPAFVPEGLTNLGEGGRFATSGVATVGGNGYARTILHDGSASAGMFGQIDAHNVAFVCSAGDKNMHPFTVPAGGVWVKEIQVGIQGDVSAGEKFRGTIYTSISGFDAVNSSDALVSYTADYSLVATDVGRMISLQLAAWTFLAAGDYWFGPHQDSTTYLIRKSTASGNRLNSVADTFSDGPTATYGASAARRNAWGKMAMPYFTFDPTGL